MEQVVAFVLEAFFAEMEMQSSAKESDNDENSTPNQVLRSLTYVPLYTVQKFKEFLLHSTKLHIQMTAAELERSTLDVLHSHFLVWN